MSAYGDLVDQRPWCWKRPGVVARCRRDLSVSPYTDELFSTGNDVDNRAAVAAVSTEDLSIAGFAVADDAKQVDKALDKLRFHP